MNTMKYKKYIGSVEVSLEDNVLHGKLLHIKDLVTYEASSPAELEQAFHDAVDDYVADCAEDGVEADVPFKGSFNVRVSPGLHRKLAMSAHAKDCTMNDYVKTVLEMHEDESILSASTTHVHLNLDRWVRHNQAHVAKPERTFAEGSGDTVVQFYQHSVCKNRLAKCH